MTGPIILMLLSINFNIVSGINAGLGGTSTAKRNNVTALILQCAAILWAVIYGMNSILS